MENEVFGSLVASLEEHLGARNLHDSGTGVRFKSLRKGKATVYHSGIAPGNQAEVAFDVESMARRLQISEGDFKAFVLQLRTSTGRPVEPNAQFNWTRVGLASKGHADLVANVLRDRFAQTP